MAQVKIEIIADATQATGEFKKFAGAADKQLKETADSTIRLQQGLQAVSSALAAVGLARFVQDLAETRARTEVLQIVMENVAKVNKISADEATRAADAIAKLGITTQESRQSVTQFIQAQLDLEKATKLARVAQDAAVVSGENSSQAFQGLLHGILTLQPEVLRTRGIVVNLAAEFDKMAESLGKDTKELTGTEKQTAALNAVLQVGATLTGTYEAAMSKAGKQLTSLPRFVEEAKNALGGPLQEAFSAAIIGITSFLKLLIDAPEPVQKLVVGVTLFATAVTGLAGAIAAAQLLALPAAFAALASPVGLVVVGIAALTAAVVVFLPEIKALYANLQQSQVWQAFTASMSLSIEGLKQLFTIGRRVVEVIVNLVRAVTEMGAKFAEAGGALIDSFVKGIQAAAERPIVAVKEMLLKLRNMLPFSPAKEGPLSDLDDAGLAFSTTFAGGIDAGRRFVTGSVERIARDAIDALPGEGLAEAFFRGFVERAERAESALARMADAGRRVFEDLRAGFSDILFEGIIDGIDGIEKAFKSMGQRLLRIFTDTFAQIVFKQLALMAGLERVASAGTGGAVGTTAGGVGGIGGLLTQFPILGQLLQVGTSAGLGFGGGGGGFGIGNIMSSLFGGLNSLVDWGLTQIFDLLTQGGTSFLGFGGSAAAGIAGEMIGNLVPIIGTGIAVITNLINGNIRGASLIAAGAIIGSFIPVIGTAVGAMIGALVDFIIGLFEGPPTARLYVQFQSTFMGKQKEFLDGIVGSFGAWVGADMPEAEAKKLSKQIEDALSGLLRQLLSATLKIQEVLPPAITAAMNMRLQALATSSPFLAQGEREFNLEEPEELKAAIEALPNQMIQLFSEAIFGGIDLTSLQQPGEVLGDTFVRVLNSMVGFTQVLEALGADMDALVESLGNGHDALRLFVQQSVAFFQQFAKEGEKFEDTLKRVLTAFTGIQAAIQANALRMAQLSGDTGQAFTVLVENLAKSEERLVQMADQLTIAVESGAQPDDILALAQALSQAVDQNLQAVASLVQGLNQIRAAILSVADLLADITIEINRLGGETLDVFPEALLVAQTLWAQFQNDVMARIAIFNSGLKLAASDVALLAQSLPILTEAFVELIEQIREMTSAAQAVAALQALAQGISLGLSAAIASTQASFTAQRDAIQASSDARIDALNDEKSRIQEVFDARREALNKELELTNKWASVLKSVESQLRDLFNLMAPTQPLTSLQEVQAQFRAAVSAFQLAPTPELAEQIQELGRQVIQLAQGVPGFDLPSLAFQAIVDEVTQALTMIAGMAETGRTTEQIQEEISLLEGEQARALASIDARIEAVSQATQAQLADLSAQEQAAIRSLEASAAAALRDIRAELVVRMEELRLQELAASEALRELLGDKSFEQFIAEKQAQAVTMLQMINDTLEHYLGAIARQVAPAQLPTAQHGMDYVPRTGPVLVHQGEMILPPAVAEGVRRGEGSGNVTITIAPTIHMQVSGDVNKGKLEREMDEVLTKIVRGPSKTRGALIELSRRHK